MEQQVEFILQTFNGKAYTEEARGPRKVVEALFERLRGNRRIVLAAKARDPVPKYRKPTGCRSNRDADTIIGEYLTWAKDKGLPSVAVYRERWCDVEKFGLTARYVSKADFLGDAPAAEIES